MNKYYVIVIVTLLAIVGGIFLLGRGGDQAVVSLPMSASPSPTPIDEKVNVTASFKIVTGNITRSFTNPKYHNQSLDVFISADNSTKVHVTKSGITWADFFNTLPMKLTKDCLITGDGETLCDGQGGSLKFYLNDVEDKDLLDKEIKEGDKILIIFK